MNNDLKEQMPPKNILAFKTTTVQKQRTSEDDEDDDDEDEKQWHRLLTKYLPPSST